MHYLKRQKRQAIWINTLMITDIIYTRNIGLNNSVLSPIQVQAIASSFYVNNATLQNEYNNSYGERVQVYSFKLNQIVSAEELKRSLESATAVITRVILIRREGMYVSSIL